MNQRARLLRRTFLAVLLLIVGSMLAVTAYTLWRLRVDAIANALEISAMHARSFEDFVTQNLHVTELIAANTLAREARPPDPRQIERTFTTTLRHVPFLRSMSLLGDNGRIVASSNPANVGVSVPTEGFLPPAIATPGILRIGPPWVGRDFADGRLATDQAPVAADVQSFIPMTRTLTDAGQPALTLLGTLNPDYFVNHFSRKLDAVEGSVDVLRYDGTLLLSTDPAKHPGSRQDYVVRDLHLDAVESGQFERRHDDGRHLLTAFRASRLYPFVIITHIDRNHALRYWRAETKTLLGVVVPVLLAITLLALVFYRRQMQLAAQRAEAERLQQINATVFGASADAIIITDLDANIISTNAAFTRITGYGAEEALGRNPRLVASGQQDKEFYERMWRDIMQDGVWRGEFVNRRKDGSLYDVQATITAARDHDGHVRHFIGVTTDITERKRHEAELLAAKERAEQAARVKTVFLATMSHEIRTPMNGIIGMTELALMDCVSDGQREHLNLAKASADALLTILNEILDYSKIEAGKVEIESIPFHVGNLMREVASINAPLVAGRGLTLRLELDPNLPDILIGDPVRLRQIIGNLLNNAIKFTHQGGIVIECRECSPLTMTTAATAATEATEANVTDERHRIAFSVTDTGIGVPVDRAAFIFDAFSQADNSTTRRYGGTGLGLAICRRLVDLMDGTISLDSTPGQGSRFTVEMPFRVLAGEPARPTPTATVTTTPAVATIPVANHATTTRAVAPGRRILVAEDVATNQAMMRALLGKRGHAVTIAADGAEAIAAFERGGFDLIFMDMQMPNVDGIEATRRIRQIETQREARNKGVSRIPIIALTANAFESDREACLAAGMDDFLAKPVSAARLNAIIDTLSFGNNA